MSTSGRTFLWTMTGGLAALAVGMALLVLTYGESKAQPPSAGEVSTVRGTLDRFTTAPMGEVDGAVLDDGTWLHWPPHLQSRFKDILSAGDRVRATGRTETGPAGDTHFEVQSVANLRTDDTAENPDFANGPPPPPPGPGPAGKAGKAGKAAPPPPPGSDRRPRRTDRDNEDTSAVRGRVDRFTTAPLGEVDGAILDDGTWLHWPPHLQNRFTDIIKEGDRVRATGRTETGPAGDTHFEVQRVTNLRSDAVAENPDFANGPPTPPDRRRLSLDGAGDTERRLRALEDKVDRLLREVERLRRDR